MNLNLTAAAPPSAFIEAVNDARFVRTFGVIALLGSILAFVGGAVAIAVGIAVIGFGGKRFYRTLGVAVVVLAILGFFAFPFRILASLVLAMAVVWQGVRILKTLSREGKDDSDWRPARTRAVTGIVLSIIGLIFSFAWLGLFVIGSLARTA